MPPFQKVWLKELTPVMSLDNWQLSQLYIYIYIYILQEMSRE